MEGRMKSVLESFVIGAIILVLAQTFLEDFAVLMDWTWNLRMVLVYTGFFFDLFFTVEFLSRLYVAVYNGKGGQYFTKERGWIDFLASIPLLLLSSGPAVLTLVTGGSVMFALGGMLNVLKVVKAVRIARILRLLRVLKIFKQIKYADSVMAQRHVAKLTAMTVTLFVLLLFAASLGLSLLDVVSVDELFTARYQATAEQVVQDVPEEGRAAREYLETLSGAEDLLLVKQGDKTIYSAHDNPYYRANYGPSDYQYIELDGFHFYFDVGTLLELQAKDSLVYFAIVVIFVIALLVVYSPHFALTVTDPIQVMRKGIEDDSYNLEVKIPERYKSDDIYKLADAYNRVYLPLKDRSRVGDEAMSSVLELEDLKDIFGDD
jgi:hypothetical protein